MSFTLAQAKEHVHSEVKGGSCKDSPIVVKRINQAIMYLMKRQYGNGEFAQWCVKVEDNCFLLPPEIETAELITVDCEKAGLKMPWYDYVNHRVPPEAYSRCTPLEVVDMGDGHVTAVELTKPMLLTAISKKPPFQTPAEKTGLEVLVTGRDGDREPVVSHKDDKAINGAWIPIHEEVPRYTVYDGREVRFFEVESVSKPETNWPVEIRAYEHAKGAVGPGNPPEMITLCTMMPWETTVCRRRYKIRGNDCPSVVHVFGRARYRRVTQDHEPLLIQDLDAILNAIQKHESASRGDLNAARFFKREAQENLDKSLSRHLGPNHEPVFTPDPGYGFGDIERI